MTFQQQKNLPKGTIFTSKDVQYAQTKDSGAMKQLINNKNIAGTLDKVEERGEFYKIMQEQAGGKGKSVTRDIMRKTLGYFRSGRGKTIDKGEAQKLASEFSHVLGGNKYIFTKEEKKPSNNPVVSPRGGSLPTTKAGGSSGKGYIPRPKLF